MLLADRIAPMAMYHAGRSSAQLRIHKAPLLQARIINTVTDVAIAKATREGTRCILSA
jgi:hypothetical protein